MSKNNVHPDHYKVGGRDRQDDAAAARFARAVAAKASSQQRPDRMTKGPYFQRPEKALAVATTPATPARKKVSSGAGTAKKADARKRSAPKRPAARKTAGRTRRTAKPATRKK